MFLFGKDVILYASFLKTPVIAEFFENMVYIFLQIGLIFLSKDDIFFSRGYFFVIW